MTGWCLAAFQQRCLSAIRCFIGLGSRLPERRAAKLDGSRLQYLVMITIKAHLSIWRRQRRAPLTTKIVFVRMSCLILLMTSGSLRGGCQ